MALWAILKPSFDACLALFHISVLLCIVCEKAHKNSRFSSVFYTLYVLQSSFDIVLVLTYGLCIGLANFGIFVPHVNVGLALGTYAQLGQGIAHAIISYNRFSAIVQPTRHKLIWTMKKTAAACIFALLLPAPVLVVKLQVQYALVANEATGGYNVSSTNGPSTLVAILALAYCSTTALISAILEAATFVTYHKMSRALRTACRDDYKLLLYAASQFIGELLLAFCTSSQVVRTFVNVPYFLAVVPYAHHITVDILGLSGPVCLLVTSESTRSSYFNMFCVRAHRVHDENGMPL